MKCKLAMKSFLTLTILSAAIISSASANTYTVPATQGTETISFGVGNDNFLVQVTDGRVVGGVGSGSLQWTVVGGFYDGNYLHATFATSQQTNCNKWLTHSFVVGVSSVTLISTVDKCGQTYPNRNAVYQRNQ